MSVVDESKRRGREEPTHSFPTSVGCWSSFIRRSVFGFLSASPSTALNDVSAVRRSAYRCGPLRHRREGNELLRYFDWSKSNLPCKVSIRLSTSSGRQRCSRRRRRQRAPASEARSNTSLDLADCYTYVCATAFARCVGQVGQQVLVCTRQYYGPACYRSGSGER